MALFRQSDAKLAMKLIALLRNEDTCPGMFPKN